MKTKSLLILIVTLLAASGGAYWYFLTHGPDQEITATPGSSQTRSNGFTPIPRNSTSSTVVNSPQTQVTATTSAPVIQPVKISTLRLISDTPVGGYDAVMRSNLTASKSQASTTLDTTIIRWVDRGRGNVYELAQDSENVTTLSNTILPRVYSSIWNKNLTAFIGAILPDDLEMPTVLYAQLIAQSTSTSSTTPNGVDVTPYVLKGLDLPDNVLAFASSPKKDQVFIFIAENSRGVGYTASFDGKNLKKIFDTPITEVTVDWPEDNTIAITTKGGANYAGFLYFVNPKTGAWKKVVGPILGLSAKVSHDAKKVLLSGTGANQNVLTSIYDVAKGTEIVSTVKTLADKCVWGNFYRELVYCGVPSENIAAVYPDDWYRGTISTIDKIWQINSTSGEVRLISSIVDKSDRVIDAFNLGLDPKDNYLFFMNKRDLSLWSLDLVTSN